jgi:transcriptional regulator with XRE-family HTH domain
MRKYTETLSGIIESSGLNLNQISKVSGISNAYLTKLVKGNINKPGKDKIASILLALNHSISEINGVLAKYDYMPLNRHDIPDILDNNRRRKFEGRILPQFDNIYFELLMAALENIGGTKILVKHRPSGIFLPSELYMMKAVSQPNQTARPINFSGCLPGMWWLNAKPFFLKTAIREIATRHTCVGPVSRKA